MTLTLIHILLGKILWLCSRLWLSVLSAYPSPLLSLLSLFFPPLCSKRHPPPLRAGWSPSCCPSCAWSWSYTLAGAGVSAAASLSPRRAPVPRRLMRSTTSHQCWWEARPERAWGIPGVRGRTPAVPSASERHRFWMGTSSVWVDIGSCYMQSEIVEYKIYWDE